MQFLSKNKLLTAAQIASNGSNTKRSSISLSEDLRDMYEQTAKINCHDSESSNYFSMLFSYDSSRIGSVSASSLSNSSESLNRVVVNQIEEE